MPESVPINLADFEPLAEARVDPSAWGYLAGGSDDEVTLRDNVEAFRRLRLRPRVLVDVSVLDPATEAFGVSLPHPFIVAPMAAHDLAHTDAEAATARGSARSRTLFTLSTISSVPMEEVAAAARDGPRWFQLYASTDRDVTRGLVERAAAAGFGALVVTVDLPYAGNRERDVRSSFRAPLGVHLPAEQPVDERGLVITSTFEWEWLRWLRSITPIPLVAKGILRADDALRAVEAGCDGIWVSNHGGRQLDTAVAGIDALPEVAEAVGRRALLIVDGGVRRGTDVIKGLALGADLVAVGRPVLWGLAVDGEAGVDRILAILRRELELAMALCGARTVAELTPDLVARR
jgi:4-hydroxymandelate oxidase